MGFFSWNCKVCNHSILSDYSTEDKNEWMKDAVAITKNGCVIVGESDGYARIGGADLINMGCVDPQMYHRECWELIGKQVEFTEPSPSSEDQGFFFGEGVHNFTPEEARANPFIYKEDE